ncbi:hypothetical protein [Sphingomonas sp. IC4-52]|uniref:hypothetical protein n=1 Tax=Sphingomonas sp. IC4-52 TaxID=2887202 RepID=UPI001D1141EA|nr:hypothetical protein [Sphingomonas sp. IC4-52]MCC2978821.1 hypothetical protein [Sphingomonas sp. IC4-52]
MERLSPEERRRRSERGKITARDVLFQPEVRARTMAPEVRQQAGRAKTETILGWCPPHLRDTYRHLVNRKHIPAAEARAMIDEEVARQERARLAALTPLQRQIERLEKGGTLTAKFTPKKAEHAFTLGGVGSGLL